jgi:hypothetical protein
MSVDYDRITMNHVVTLGSEYLDYCLSRGNTPTLVGMFNHIDYNQRNVANLDDVNEILNQRPEVFFQRTDKGIVFNSTGGERTLTREDMNRGYVDYRNDFHRRYKDLQARNRMAAGPDFMQRRNLHPAQFVSPVTIQSCCE